MILSLFPLSLMRYGKVPNSAKIHQPLGLSVDDKNLLISQRQLLVLHLVRTFLSLKKLTLLATLGDNDIKCQCYESHPTLTSASHVCCWLMLKETKSFLFFAALSFSVFTSLFSVTTVLIVSVLSFSQGWINTTECKYLWHSGFWGIE